MTDMTMGQRIAVQRKLKNLSQEALAEQLEVSRQAVSKWEQDAAIPDVDKLIVLGKIFGVSVGWLLGTEKENLDFYHKNQEVLSKRDVFLKCQSLPAQASNLVKLHLFCPEETAVIGDRIYTDVKSGLAAGCTGILVRL